MTVTVPALSVSSDSVTDESTIRGDADSDGKVTSRDATVIQRALLSLIMPTYNKKAADVDCDGH
ncbi:dockerin type I domain-containing protein [Ruminococcus sp.]|uniref:dockerin type I domain-containing protein n=1 Tax=Ruminococcus sp. TaxID=41978 RepID=UPI003867666C